ncbi:MAG: hypothetical protein ACK4Z0_05710 [Sphingomonadaceae bacterium]
MTGEAAPLALVAAGLACWAIAASVSAWRWRRQYRAALSQFAWLAQALPRPKAAPAKSEPHVKAARTRKARQRERALEVMRQLQAEIHAKELGW